MSNFVSLDEAAKKLGVSSEELVEMRSRGEIFGYRDGASWKFKPEEIERVASEMMGDALDEDPAGSSILVSESDLSSGSKHGSTIGSDVQSDDVDSDVELVADPGSGSDVRLVASKSGDSKSSDKEQNSDKSAIPASDDDDEELALESDDDDLMPSGSDSASVGSDIELGSGIDLGLGSSIDSDIPISGSDEMNLEDVDASNVVGSDLNLEGSGVGSEIIKGDSDPSIDSGSLDLAGSDLELSDDDDLVLGSGSDLALGTDSGINLMSPSDSGISLEDEPLDLAASGISGLDLAADGADDESPSGAGSAVNFQSDEEFQLSPSGGIETDEDSGSQVIELEDSSEFGDAPVALSSGGFDAFADAGAGGLDNEDAFGDMAVAGTGTGVVALAAPEVPYGLTDVLLLLGILLLMCMCGILVTDIVRNMWAASGTSTLTSGFTEMLLSAFNSK